MKLSNFDYNLPESFIAQTPVVPRDSSKMLVFDAAASQVSHKVFRDILGYLKAGDVLVVNRSKVIPARILFEHKGKKVEIFRLGEKVKSDNGDVYKCLVKPGKSFRVGEVGRISDELEFEVVSDDNDGTRNIKFVCPSNLSLEKALENAGQPPYPPYIKHTTASFDQYQTVYSKEKGSVASPTAGLHFTEELLNKVGAMGVSFETVLLHVGLGTFLPVKTENIEDHEMHSEFYEMNKETADFLNKARSEGRRIIAVGTTSVRVLESSFIAGSFRPTVGETKIFIYPGYKWKCVDALITNFHLPKSTLLMLVASFLENKGVKDGTSKILELYEIVKNNNYRFFSFGDSMMIV